ncbi:SGNH/GDSL hydrolase family protein [Serratia quinivorans]|uniref:SGNH/GDSL hydrolase family protein n=1 Tax=Serratia quinivorans TaxID=137545 RepID=UPI003F9AEF8D
MSFSDTAAAKKYAAIAEVAASEAQAFADYTRQAEDFSSQAAESASAAEASSTASSESAAQAEVAASTADDAATSANSAAEVATAAASAATLASNIYPTAEAAQDAITAGTIPLDALFNVASTVAENYVDQYKNVAGVATPTGKSYPSSEVVDEAKAISAVVDKRTLGVNTVNPDDGRHIFTDIKGRMSLEIKANGEKALYGKSVANDISVSERVTMGVIDQVPSDDSAYRWCVSGRNNRVGVGFRNDDKTLELHGVPITTQRGQMPNDVFSIGDSITAFGTSWSGTNATGTSYYPLINAQCWSGWAMLKTGARYRYVGMSATGGYTASQILAVHVPKAIAAKPSFCIVMCGRNDVVKGIDVDTVTIPAMTSIFRQLRFAGIVPVICSMSAQSGNTDAMNVARYKINSFCRAYAIKYGLPFVDLHAATTDPLTGEWKANYNQDVSHPTPLGASVMGQAVADAMVQWQAPTTPRKSVSVTTPAGSDNILSNPLFIDSSSGVPNGWTVDSSGTFSVASDPNVLGNAFTMSGSGSSIATAHNTLTVTSGNRYGFGFEANITANISSWVSFYAIAGTSTTETSSTVYLGGMRNWKLTTSGWGYYYFEFVVPVGETSMTIIAKAQDGTLNVAQAGVFNISDTTGA